MRFLTHILLFLPSLSFAQITLDRQVIGATGGGSIQPNFSIDYTVGEPVVTTVTNGFTLTQGFHQPARLIPITLPLSATFTLRPESCFGASDGTITVSNIQGCDGPYTIEWSDFSTGTSLENLTAGTAVSVTVSSSDGCSITESFTMTLNPGADCSLEIFNAFSPNGDGKNDTWYIGNALSWQPNAVTIYDRWGSTVWSAENYDNADIAWSGVDKNGKMLPDGTYFFVFVAGEEVRKGYVEITR